MAHSHHRRNGAGIQMLGGSLGKSRGPVLIQDSLFDKNSGHTCNTPVIRWFKGY